MSSPKSPRVSLPRCWRPRRKSHWGALRNPEKAVNTCVFTEESPQVFGSEGLSPSPRTEARLSLTGSAYGFSSFAPGFWAGGVFLSELWLPLGHTSRPLLSPQGLGEQGLSACLADDILRHRMALLSENRPHWFHSSYPLRTPGLGGQTEHGKARGLKGAAESFCVPSREGQRQGPQSGCLHSSFRPLFLLRTIGRASSHGLGPGGPDVTPWRDPFLS